MGTMYILTKDGDYTHTYSKNKGDKLMLEGWKPIIRIEGWNMSITIIKGKQ